MPASGPRGPGPARPSTGTARRRTVSTRSTGGGRQSLGRDGEARAEALLGASGLQLVERNYRCRSGEVDLVMRDGDVLVFVEVRYRSRQDYGGGVLSVDVAKQRRLARVAAHYLQARGVAGDVACRFDVVALGPDAADTNWIADAFEVTSWI